MKTTPTTTPAWVPHLMAALLTVASTWTLIRTEVRSVVREEIVGELDTHRHKMDQGARQLLASYSAGIDTTIRNVIKQQADSVTKAIGLMPVQTKTGQVVYQPNIVVQQDTAIYNGIRADMAQLKERADSTAKQLTEFWELLDVKQTTNGRKTKWKVSKQ